MVVTPAATAAVEVSRGWHPLVHALARRPRRHQAILEAGLACRHGSLQAQPVTVLGPSDVRSQLRLHTDSAQVWSVHAGQFGGALVALRIHAVVVQYAVIARDGAGSRPDVKKVVVAGLTKLYAVARG